MDENDLLKELSNLDEQRNKLIYHIMTSVKYDDTNIKKQLSLIGELISSINERLDLLENPIIIEPELPTIPQEVKAFPSAIGAGAYTTGGRGGQVSGNQAQHS